MNFAAIPAAGAYSSTVGAAWSTRLATRPATVMPDPAFSTTTTKA